MTVTIKKKDPSGASIKNKTLNLNLEDLKLQQQESKNQTGKDQSGIDSPLNWEKVNLYQAKALYQPVFSTDPKSTYNVVAISSKGLKMAARYKNGVLSLRLEGNGLAAFKGGTGLVFSHSSYTSQSGDAVDYASLHLNAMNLVMAKRALGAVLVQHSKIFSGLIPNLDVIYKAVA